MNPFKTLVKRVTRSFETLFGLVPWVNVYTVSRAYGGAEAGGWYYRKYKCEQSKQTWRWASDALQCQLQRKFEGLAWGILSSETDGQEIVVLIEQRKAGKEYVSRPPYEPQYIVEQPDRVKLEALEQQKAAQEMKPAPKAYRKKRPSFWSNSSSHKTKLLKQTSSKQMKRCLRCNGTGKTRYKHIQNGVCFMCKGSGKVRTYRSKAS
ncbi:hypothetical protein [Paenibacillus sp. AGC30]